MSTMSDVAAPVHGTLSNRPTYGMRWESDSPKERCDGLGELLGMVEIRKVGPGCPRKLDAELLPEPIGGLCEEWVALPAHDQLDRRFDRRQHVFVGRIGIEGTALHTQPCVCAGQHDLSHAGIQASQLAFPATNRQELGEAVVGPPACIPSATTTTALTVSRTLFGSSKGGNSAGSCSTAANETRMVGQGCECKHPSAARPEDRRRAPDQGRRAARSRHRPASAARWHCNPADGGFARCLGGHGSPP